MFIRCVLFLDCSLCYRLTIYFYICRCNNVLYIISIIPRAPIVALTDNHSYIQRGKRLIYDALPSSTCGRLVLAPVILSDADASVYFIFAGSATLAPKYVLACVPCMDDSVDLRSVRYR